MKKLALFAVLAVAIAALIGCNSGSRTVSQMIYADPDSTWAAVKRVIASKQSVMPASIDEKNRIITIKNAFGNIENTTNEHGEKLNNVESFDAVISMTIPVVSGSSDPKKAEYTFLNIKVSSFRPIFSTSDEKRISTRDDSGDSYGFKISNSSDVHDQFIREVQKELDAIKAQETAQKAEK